MADKTSIPQTRSVSSDYKAPGLKRPQETKGESPISPDSETEGEVKIESVSVFEKERGHPYTVDYYQLNTPYEFVDEPMKENLEEINTFIKGQLEDGGQEPSLENYSKVLRDFEKKIGINDGTLRNLAIVKMSNLARNFNLVLNAFNKTVRRKVLKKLLKMTDAGYSDFDQTEFILEKLGGLV